jgi:hypothetical protein
MADDDEPQGSGAARADSPEGTRWLSYDELAEVSGIKRESVIRLVRRKMWPKRDGNTPGDVRVAVPAGVLAEIEARKPAVKAAEPDVREDIPPDVLPELSRTIKLFETALRVFGEQLDREQRRVAQLETALDQERRRADELGALTAQLVAAQRVERERLLAQIEALTAKGAADPPPVPVQRSRLARLLRWR